MRSQKRAGCRRSRRRDRPHGAGVDDHGEQALKPEPRKCSDTSCMIDRVAQVGLVGAVFEHRLVIGNAREQRLASPACRWRTSSNTPAHHRLHRVEHVFLRDEAHLEVELVELARQSGRRAGLRRGSRARSGNSGRSPPPSAAACTAAAPAAARRTCPDGCGSAPGSRARLPATRRSGSASGTR
jgi:hypothetical protein